MRAVQGALIVASSVQIILGYSQLWAICSRFFSPLGMVPVIALTGFGLFDRGFPVVGRRCVEIGIPMIILFLGLSQHFQKDIERGCQGVVSVSSKQMDIVRKFAEDCCKYGSKRECSTSPPSEVAFQMGASHNHMEKEREIFLGILSNKVCDPLRALVRDPQLEDARLLVHHYERLCQEVENQAIEVVRQRSKSRDSAAGENPLKLQIAEAKLDDLKSRLTALGKDFSYPIMHLFAGHDGGCYTYLR